MVSAMTYTEEEITMAKKCIINKWDYPPPYFFNKYFKRYESNEMEEESKEKNDKKKEKNILIGLHQRTLYSTNRRRLIQI